MKRKLLIAALVVVGILALGVGLLGQGAPNLSAGFKSESVASREMQVSVYGDGTIVNDGENIISGELTSKSSRTVKALVPYELASKLETQDELKIQFSNSGKWFKAEVTKVGSELIATGTSEGYEVSIKAEKVPDQALSGMSVTLDFKNDLVGSATVMISEFEIADIKVGQEAEVRLLSDNSLRSGEVVSIGTTADSSTGVVKYPIQIEFPTDSQTLLTGMSVAVKIQVEASRQAIAVPLAAISEVDGSAQVQVLVDSIPQTKTVQLGIESDGYVEVISGLTEGDLVVTGVAESTPSGSSGFMPPAPDQFGGN